MAKLSDADWEIAKKLRQEGQSWAAIGKRFGVSHQALSKRAAKEGASQPQPQPQPQPKPPQSQPRDRGRRIAAKAVPKQDRERLRPSDAVEVVVVSDPGCGEGRPSLYRKEFCNLAYNYCLLGASRDDLSAAFGVCENTIQNWMDKHPEFRQAILEGRTIADAKVARGLFELATGYSHPDEKIFMHQGEIVRAEYNKVVPPDVAAAKMWLINRQPTKWRDKVDVAFEDVSFESPEEREVRRERFDRAMANAAVAKERLLERCKSLDGEFTSVTDGGEGEIDGDEGGD